MTFNEIQLDVYRRLNLTDTPPTRVVNRLNGFINQRHRQLLSMQGIEQLRDDVIPFDTITGQPVYSLPPSVGRIKVMYGPDGEKLVQRSLDWVRSAFTNTSYGDPCAYVPLGLRAVQQQPAAETALEVVSTSASDVAHATVEVVRLGGYQDTVTVLMTGTTPVAVGTLTDVVSVSNFQLESEAVGFVTLETANSEVLATISPNKTSARYLAIQLAPTPGSVQTIQVDYTRALEDLILPGDVPLLPLDFHYLLSLGARIDEYEHLDDDRRNELHVQWMVGYKRLLNFVCNNPDYIVVPGGGQVEFSSLGPDYPAGS